MIKREDYPELTDKQFKRKKRRRRWAKFLAFILVVVLLVTGINFLKDTVREKKERESLKTDASWSQGVVLTKEQKEQDWNDDGISNGEAMQKGLDPSLTDTDGDGLSDYDEINTYKSNPCAYSSANDGHSDAWKVENGIDPFAISEQKPVTLEENPNITLNPKEDGDSERYVYKESDASALPINQDYLDCFTIYSFGGDIVYKTDKDVTIYSIGMFDFKLTELKTRKVSGGVQFANIPNTTIVVYGNSIDAKTINAYNEKTTFYLVMYPIFNFTGKTSVKVFYDKNVGYNDEEISKDFTAKAKAVWAEECKKNGEDPVQTFEFGSKSITVTMPEFEFVGVSKPRLALIKTRCDEMDVKMTDAMKDEDEVANNFLQGMKSLLYVTSSVDGTYNDLVSLLIGSVDDNEVREDNAITVDYYREAEEWDANKNSPYYANSGFDISKNAFRFSNLQTNVANGVCAGFATETARIYNEGKLDPCPKPIELNDYTYSYDYTDNNAYNFTTTKNLYGFVPQSEDLSTYCDNDYKSNFIASEWLEEPDAEVVKSLEYYWKWCNSENVGAVITSDLRINNGVQYKPDFKNIENIKNEFNKGNIVTVLVAGKNGAHAINAYKLEQSSYSNDVFYIRCYDNNFPLNQWIDSNNKKHTFDVTINVARIYEKDVFGKVHEKYLWSYMPSDSHPNYSWSNADYNSKDFDSIFFRGGYNEKF